MRPKGGWKSNQHKPNRTPYSKPNNKSYKPSSGSSSRSSNQSNQSSSRKCFKCGRNGHMLKECRTCECKKCGRPGHLTRDCKTNEYQRCGKVGHKSHDCRAGAYTEILYKELQKFWKDQRDSHSLDAPSLDGTDPEDYTVIVESLSTHNISETDGEMVLLDSSSKHTIMRDPCHVR